MRTLPTSIGLLGFSILLWYVISIARLPDNYLGDLWGLLHAPRLSAAIIAGLCFGLAGALLQVITRNPLASPSVLGVTSGGQMGWLLSLMLSADWRPPIFVGVLVGCLLGASITLLVAGGRQAEPLQVILGGTVNNIMLSGFTTLILILNDKYLPGKSIWQAGSLFQENWNAVFQTLPVSMVTVLVVCRLARPMMLLMLGDEQAQANGVRIDFVQRIGIFCAIALTAIAVTLAGPIAFVGLLAPHFARYFGCARFDRLLLGSAIWGVVIVCLADALIQSLATFLTLPLGLICSIIGAPFLLFLLARVRPRPSSVGRFQYSQINHPAFSWITLIVATLMLPILVYLGALTGSIPVQADALLKWITQSSSPYQNEVLQMRLGRCLLAMTIGMLLAAAGWLMQKLMRNPLATPEITGISQGGALTALALMLVWPEADQIFQAAATVIGSIISLSIVLVLNRKGGYTPVQLIVSGLTLTGLFTAISGMLLILFKTRAAPAFVWLSGSLYARELADFLYILPSLLLLLPVFCCVRPLTLINLGDEQAQTLGLALTRWRLGVLVLATVITALCVAVAGPLAFVGLLAPHIAVRSIGNRRPYLTLLLSLLYGAMLCMLADTIGRSIAAPKEIPMGLMTTILGAPYLLTLLLKYRKHRS